MMTRRLLPPHRPRTSLPEPPPRPGLSPEAVAGLDPAAVSARVAAAEARETEGDRRAVAARLAQRVAAAAPPPPVAPVAPVSPESTSAPETPPRKPWRDTPLVVSTRRREPEPPTLTPDDLATLGRLLARAPHRTTTTIRRNIP